MQTEAGASGYSGAEWCGVADGSVCSGGSAEEGTVGATALATWQGREHRGVFKVKRGPCYMLKSSFMVDNWQ